MKITHEPFGRTVFDFDQGIVRAIQAALTLAQEMYPALRMEHLYRMQVSSVGEIHLDATRYRYQPDDEIQFLTKNKFRWLRDIVFTFQGLGITHFPLEITIYVVGKDNPNWGVWELFTASVDKKKVRKYYQTSAQVT